MSFSKTKTSFYRRLLVADLIEGGIHTVPMIMAECGMPRRTAQDTITALADLDIVCEFQGAKKDGHYAIVHWGAINPDWIRNNRELIRQVLGYE